MAVLAQSDYEALAPQIVTGKRTSGPNTGKRIVATEMWRGYHVGGNTTGDPTLQVRLTFSDGTAETLSFAGTEAYPPGAADTLAHYHS